MSYRNLTLFVIAISLTACGDTESFSKNTNNNTNSPQPSTENSLSNNTETTGADAEDTDTPSLHANDQVITLYEDTKKTFFLTATGSNGREISYTVLDQPIHGAIDGIAPKISYTPNSNFSGNDNFTFKVSYGEFDSNTATISITIDPINDPPHAESISIELTQNSRTNITLEGSDVENSAISYTFVGQPSHGTLNGTSPNLTYAPDIGYQGKDAFTYWVSDGELDSRPATVAITINTFPTIFTPLNDTGITWGGNFPSGNNTSCIGETITQQDCSHGRDFTDNIDSDGLAGFSYTKLDTDGGELPLTATEWACVKDNVTGLIWENKTGGNGVQGDEGLHDTDDRYYWYNTNSNTNGGSDGYLGSGSTCYGYTPSQPDTYCNTEAYVNRVNSTGLCGANNWQLPTKAQLLSLVNLGKVSPSIDTNFFPYTESEEYWSSSPLEHYIDSAWIISFSKGYVSTKLKNSNLAIRLVRHE